MARLTDDQKEILRVVELGHNALITGQAGTGKTFLVKEIVNRLQRQGKNVKIICSSGIAATVYEDLRSSVSTVHSFYRLQTAELPWKSLVSRSLQDRTLCENVKRLDCLIWDEISMSSRRMLEIVNQLHISLNQEETVRPFNGIQVILVGEFLQLRPVPNFLDNGEFMFQSPVFDRAITHRYELTSLMRQDHDEEFISCLKELRLGQCTDTTKAYIKGLCRNLPDDLEDKSTHIFFKKISAQVFNMNRLCLLPGEEHRFQAIDQGDTKGIPCQAESLLVLKPGCKVMLVWNINERLRNGTEGKYIDKDEDEDQIIVEFPNAGKIGLKQQVWQRRGMNGEIVGTRTQFPLILMYGITCHKSQGLTLPAVVIHSSKEFVPGLMYVAFTRVRKASQLQVINFNPKQLVPPFEKCINVCANHSEIEDSHNCCREKYYPKLEWTIFERGHEDLADEEDADVAYEIDEVAKRVINSYYERGEQQDFFLDLDTVYAVLSEEQSNDFMRIPPTNFSVRQLLTSMKIEEPLSNYASSKNIVVEELLTSEEQEILGKIMWSRACKIILEESIMNATCAIQVSSKQWSLNTKELYLLITRSEAFMRDLKLLFGVDELSQAQAAIGAELMIAVYSEVVGEVADKVRSVELDSPVVMDVRQMASEGLSKIRHVGAWAIAKVYHKQVRYIRQNMASNAKKTLTSVQKSLNMIHLLDENVIANISQLQQSTKYPQTLELTEERQYRSRGLTHIEDEPYEFFIELEVLRVDNLNHAKLKRQKENLIDNTLNAALKSPMLFQKWQSCFSQVQDDDHDHKVKEDAVKTLYHLVVKKFMKAGAGQYLRDFRLAYRIKKSTEHRKKVLERKAALEITKASVPYGDLVADTTAGKVHSHHRLIAYVEHFGEPAFVKVYKKPELITICKAYGITSMSKTTKASLVKQLIPILKSSQFMVHSYYLDNLQSQVNIDNENQRVSLTITRSS